MGIRTRREKFPWLALTLLLASVFVFWVLPRIQRERTIRVEFVEKPSR